MKSEFKRFGLAKVGTLTAILEILGALGLLIGLKFNPFLLVSAGGLAVLMLLGVAVRIKVRDTSVGFTASIVFYDIKCIYFLLILINIERVLTPSMLKYFFIQ